MSKPAVIVAIVWAMGCSGSPPPPASPASAATSDETEPTEPTEPTELSEPLGASPDEPAPLAELIQACEGTNLDVEWWMRNLDQCRDGDVSQPPMPSSGLIARIEPATVRARSGTPVGIDYVLHNRTDQPMNLWPHYCEVSALRPDILDSKGEPVRQCGYGGGCGGSRSRVTLDPHGTAHLRFAEVETSAESLCLDEPLPTGEYQLIVRAVGDLPEARATLFIE